MSKIFYVIILEDRHTDTEVAILEDKEKSIEIARKIAKENCSFKEDYKEEEIEGWIFYANYSCEGDSIRVIERELNDIKYIKGDE